MIQAIIVIGYNDTPTTTIGDNMKLDPKDIVIPGLGDLKTALDNASEVEEAIPLFEYLLAERRMKLVLVEALLNMDEQAMNGESLGDIADGLAARLRRANIELEQFRKVCAEHNEALSAGGTFS